jgi:hypothetical protein
MRSPRAHLLGVLAAAAVAAFGCHVGVGRPEPGAPGAPSGATDAGNAEAFGRSPAYVDPPSETGDRDVPVRIPAPSTAAAPLPSAAREATEPAPARAGYVTDLPSFARRRSVASEDAEPDVPTDGSPAQDADPADSDAALEPNDEAPAPDAP